MNMESTKIPRPEGCDPDPGIRITHPSGDQGNTNINPYQGDGSWGNLPSPKPEM